MSDLDPGASVAPSMAPGQPIAPTGAPQPSPSANPSPTGDPQYTQRQQQQLAGYRAVADPLIRAGYNDPQSVLQNLERVKRYDGLLQAVEQRGIDPQQLVSLLNGQPQPQVQPGVQQPAPRALTVEDVPTLTDALLSRMSEREMRAAHEQGVAAERQSMTGMVSELAQQVGNERMVKAVVNDIVQEYQEKHCLYPANHPLRTKEFRPLGADDFAKIRAEVDQVIGVQVGAGLRQGAQAALQNAARPSGSLQPSGMQGQPPKSSWDRSPAEKEARAREIQERHRANFAPGFRPMSSA